MFSGTQIKQILMRMEGMWKAAATRLISECILFYADHFNIHVNQHQRAKCRL